jgi:hypothetical protein
MIVANQLDGSFSPVLGKGYRKYLAKHGFSARRPVTIDITDEGLDKGVVPPPAGSHPAFFVNGDTSQSSRIGYAQNATTDSNARDCGGHGTNVGSIAAGYSALTGPDHEDAEGFNFALGISPFAHLGATKIFNCNGSFDVSSSFTALRTFSYNQDARLANNSWGADVNGAYNTDSQEFDAIVRDAQPGVNGNQQFAEIFSAGNRRDHHLADAAAVQPGARLRGLSVGNDGANEALPRRQRRERSPGAGIANDELRVLRHVGDDLDAGADHRVDPLLLERTDVLYDQQSGAALVGEPGRMADLGREIALSDGRIEGMAADPHQPHVDAQFAAGPDHAADVPGVDLDQRELVIGCDDAGAGAGQRRKALGRIRHDHQTLIGRRECAVVRGRGAAGCG